MNQGILKCKICGYQSKEPNETKTILCPGCGAEIILITTKDLEAMEKAEIESNTVGKHHYFINNTLTIGNKKFKVKEI